MENRKPESGQCIRILGTENNHVTFFVPNFCKKHLTNTYSCYNMLISKPTYHVGKVVKETKGIAYEH